MEDNRIMEGGGVMWLIKHYIVFGGRKILSMLSDKNM